MVLDDHLPRYCGAPYHAHVEARTMHGTFERLCRSTTMSLKGKKRTTKTVGGASPVKDCSTFFRWFTWANTVSAVFQRSVQDFNVGTLWSVLMLSRTTCSDHPHYPKLSNTQSRSAWRPRNHSPRQPSNTNHGGILPTPRYAVVFWVESSMTN
jgi:hypothetical protein